jgi:hypothetical protein
MTGLALVIFRRRGLSHAAAPGDDAAVRLRLLSRRDRTFVKSPTNRAIGWAILTGLPAWWFWSRAEGRE